MIAQIANDRACGCRIERDVVQRRPCGARTSPNLGRLSLVRDALHVAAAVAQMTFATRGNRRLIADDEAGRRIALRPCASASAPAATTAATAALCNRRPVPATSNATMRTPRDVIARTERGMTSYLQRVGLHAATRARERVATLLRDTAQRCALSSERQHLQRDERRKRAEKIGKRRGRGGAIVSVVQIRHLIVAPGASCVIRPGRHCGSTARGSGSCRRREVLLERRSDCRARSRTIDDAHRSDGRRLIDVASLEILERGENARDRTRAPRHRSRLRLHRGNVAADSPESDSCAPAASRDRAADCRCRWSYIARSRSREKLESPGRP